MCPEQRFAGGGFFMSETRSARAFSPAVAGIAVVAATLVVSGCSGDDVPEAEALEQAVQASYEAQPRGCFDQVYLQWFDEFPIERPSGLGSNEVGPVLDALEGLGVIEARNSGDRDEYHLTADGEPYYREGIGLCFVEFTLTGLYELSSPFELQGRKVMTAVAQSRPKLADFAERDDFQVLLEASREKWARSVGNPRLDELVDYHREGEAFTEEVTFVKDEQGWRVSKR